METKQIEQKTILYTEKGNKICEALTKLNRNGISDAEIIRWMREWGINFDA